MKTKYAELGTELHFEIENQRILTSACRAVRRLYEDSTEDWDEYEEADAGFDAGEYSAQFWAANHERELMRILGLVSDRFGVMRAALSKAFDVYVQEESYRFVSAMLNRPHEPLCPWADDIRRERNTIVGEDTYGVGVAEDWQPDVDEHGRSIGVCPRCEHEARLDGNDIAYWRCTECDHRGPRVS